MNSALILLLLFLLKMDGIFHLYDYAYPVVEVTLRPWDEEGSRGLFWILNSLFLELFADLALDPDHQHHL